MELQTKFIEGTDEKYSIREDGVVITHYKVMTIKGERVHIMRDKELKHRTERLEVKINGKVAYISRKRLVYDYFGYMICSSCNAKIYNNVNKYRYSCDECMSNANKLRIHNFNERHSNSIEYKEKRKKYRKMIIETLPHVKVASNLNISVKEVRSNPELYETYKMTLKLKRKFAKELNVHVSVFGANQYT